MPKEKSSVESTADRDAAAAARTIVSARGFAVTRVELFRAFSDPARLAQWWGPQGFTNTFHEFDLRPGGVWRFVMRGPDGAEFHNVARFVEIAPPERIVFDHEEPVHGFRMTMTFAERGAGTTLTWRMVFASATEVARLGDFLAAANEQNFDRLQAHLSTHP